MKIKLTPRHFTGQRGLQKAEKLMVLKQQSYGVNL